MAEEINKLLGPFPILQLIFGLIVLGFGAYMIVRGTQKKDTHVQLEDKRLEWEAYERLRQIEENTAEIASNQRAMLEGVRSAVHRIENLTDQMKALAAAIWNRGV